MVGFPAQRRRGRAGSKLGCGSAKDSVHGVTSNHQQAEHRQPTQHSRHSTADNGYPTATIATANGNSDDGMLNECMVQCMLNVEC